MKRFFLVVTVLAILIVGVAFYRGWFTLTGERESQDHPIEVKLSVDTDKFKHDTGAVTEGSQTKDSQHEQ